MKFNPFDPEQNPFFCRVSLVPNGRDAEMLSRIPYNNEDMQLSLRAFASSFLDEFSDDKMCYQLSSFGFDAQIELHSSIFEIKNLALRLEDLTATFWGTNDMACSFCLSVEFVSSLTLNPNLPKLIEEKDAAEIRK